ncbi:MAG: hypothetical protein Q4C89_09380 [Deinococcus sp.]|uniref:hypothetical protein n=1 Tax=Deinococcus sp. TaxID=47478 RepID=UPI0026DCC144|nr:hypothetical protein [Deinococcus sp.]MDO4246222.1 hypothetical protein [Deinococcus sp.]
MRKILMVGMLASASFGGAATLPELFSSSPARLADACDRGYRIESMPRVTQAEKDAYSAESVKANKGNYLRDSRTFLGKDADSVARLKAMVNSIDLQTPSGSAFNICGARAEKLAAKPTPEVLSAAASTLVYIKGEALERKSAENWNAVIIALDSSGTELARFESTGPSKKGDLSSWKPSCTSAGCKWVGQNIYYFKLNTLSPQTTKLKLMFTRGNGVEQREYTAEDVEKVILTDPKTP